MLPFDAEMGKNQKAIKVLQRLFDAGYVTEKEIVNMTMDEMLVNKRGRVWGGETQKD